MCKGFDQLKINYLINIPFKKIKPNDCIIVLGTGKHVLKDYRKPNKIIAGIGLMTHPYEWPNLFEEYPVVKYLQHSSWTAAIYNKFYGNNKCLIWPSGIDTDFWKPEEQVSKKNILIYVKFLWDKTTNEQLILEPIKQYLTLKQIPFDVIKYGAYDIEEYKSLLNKSNSMIFLCEHESQGLAVNEAMSMNIPILAWEQGEWLDVNRFNWGEYTTVEASSTPYFDDRCGMKFNNISVFNETFDLFHYAVKSNKFTPRLYILENLTLKKSAEKMLTIIEEVY